MCEALFLLILMEVVDDDLVVEDVVTGHSAAPHWELLGANTARFRAVCAVESCKQCKFSTAGRDRPTSAHSRETGLGRTDPHLGLSQWYLSAADATSVQLSTAPGLQIAPPPTTAGDLNEVMTQIISQSHGEVRGVRPLSGARLHGFAQTAIIGVLKLHSLRGCVRHSTRPTASLRPFTRHGRVTGLTAQRWLVCAHLRFLCVHEGGAWPDVCGRVCMPAGGAMRAPVPVWARVRARDVRGRGPVPAPHEGTHGALRDDCAEREKNNDEEEGLLDCCVWGVHGRRLPHLHGSAVGCRP